MKVESLETLAMLGLATGDASFIIEHQEKSGQMELCNNKNEIVEIPSKENFPSLSFSTFSSACEKRMKSPENEYFHICTEVKRKKVKTKVLSLILNNLKECSSLSYGEIKKYKSSKKKIRFFVKQNIKKIIDKCMNFKCTAYKKACFENYKKILEKLKIVVIDEENREDDLFIKIKLPKGWKIERTDHHMWSKLLDEKDRERASIFYKAAFYDRDAFISFHRRFRISGEQADYDEKKFKESPEYIEDGFEEIYVNTETGKKVDTREINTCDNLLFYDSNGYELIECFSNKSRIKLHIEKKKVPKYKKNPEYVPLTGYEKYSQPFHFEVCDFDNTVLFKSDIVKTDFEYCKSKHSEFFNHRREIEEQAKKQCIDWLLEHYPDWENEFTYWD